MHEPDEGPSTKPVSDIAVELARVRAKHAAETDPDIREALQLKISQLEQRLSDADQGESSQGDRPSRAALEAQTRELQVKLLELAGQVERSGIEASKQDQEALAEVRANLAAAMKQLAEAAGISQTENLELPPKPTPSAQVEAERLIREARVMKMRGQPHEAKTKLEAAVAIAPGSVATLMALAEGCLDDGKPEEALKPLSMALRLDPDHPGLQRRFAEISAMGSEPKNLSSLLKSDEVALLLRENSAASSKASRWMSVFLPGLGQIVAGSTRLGAWLLCSWIAMLIWAILMPNGLGGLLRAVAGTNTDFNALVLIPLLIAICIHVAAVMLIEAGPEPAHEKATPLRPQPPVDLPFE